MTRRPSRAREAMSATGFALVVDNVPRCCMRLADVVRHHHASSTTANTMAAAVAIVRRLITNILPQL